MLRVTLASPPGSTLAGVVLLAAGVSLALSVRERHPCLLAVGVLGAPLACERWQVAVGGQRIRAALRDGVVGRWWGGWVGVCMRAHPYSQQDCILPSSYSIICLVDIPVPSLSISDVTVIHC